MLKAKFSSLTGEEKADPYTMETIKALSSAACIVSTYPKSIRPEDINLQIEETFAFLNEVVHTVRNIRAEMQLPPAAITDLYIYSAPLEKQRHLIENNLGIVQALGRTQKVIFAQEEDQVQFGASAIVGHLKLVIPLPEEFKDREKTRLIKQRDKYITQVNGLATQLGNDSFLEKAPPQLVEQLKKNLSQTEKELDETIKKLEELISF